MALKADCEDIRASVAEILKRIRLRQAEKSYVDGDEALSVDITLEQKRAWKTEIDAEQLKIANIVKTWGL